MFRVLRALAGEGIVTEDEDGRFGLPPTAKLLRSAHRRSVRDRALSNLSACGHPARLGRQLRAPRSAAGCRRKRRLSCGNAILGLSC